MSDKEITVNIKHPEIIALLIFLCFVFYLDFKVTLNSPIVFGDEGFHTRIAQYIATEKEIINRIPFVGTKLAVSYSTTPPMWHITEASFLFIFGYNEIIIKFLTPFIASILVGLATFLIAKRLFNKEVGFLAAIIAVTIPSFVTYSVLFYTDILFTLYLSLFMLTSILAIKERSKKYILLSSIFGAFAFLTKTPGIAVFFILGLFFLFELFKERKLWVIKKYVASLLIIFLILSPFLAKNYILYGTPACFLKLPFFSTEGCSMQSPYESKYEYAGRTEQVGTEASVYTMGIIQYLDFAYGNIWFVVLGLFAGGILLAIRKDKIDILMLLPLIIFLLLFQYVAAGRAEDVARYMLGWVPLIGIITAIWFKEISNILQKYSKYFVIVIVIIVLVYGYMNLTSKLDTMAKVKKFSPSFFEACDWVKENLPQDARIQTVWVYHTLYNCQRNVGGAEPDAVLSGNVTLALERFKANGITHIFIQKFSISDKKYSEKYPIDFVKMLNDNPQYFIKVYETGETDYNKCIYGCEGDVIFEINYTAI